MSVEALPLSVLLTAPNTDPDPPEAVTRTAWVTLLLASLFFPVGGWLLAPTVGMVALPDKAIFLLAGAVSAQVILAGLAWRSMAMHRAAHANLRAARDFLFSVISDAPDPIFVLDQKLRCVFKNPAMGRTENEPTFLIDNGSVSPRGTGVIATLESDLPHALDSAKPIEMELGMVLRDGQFRTALVKLSSHRMSSGSRYLIGVIRDISERKALEESLEAELRELYLRAPRSPATGNIYAFPAAPSRKPLATSSDDRFTTCSSKPPTKTVR